MIMRCFVLFIFCNIVEETLSQNSTGVVCLLEGGIGYRKLPSLDHAELKKILHIWNTEQSADGQAQWILKTFQVPKTVESSHEMIMFLSKCYEIANCSVPGISGPSTIFQIGPHIDFDDKYDLAIPYLLSKSHNQNCTRDSAPSILVATSSVDYAEFEKSNHTPPQLLIKPTFGTLGMGGSVWKILEEVIGSQDLRSLPVMLIEMYGSNEIQRAFCSGLMTELETASPNKSLVFKLKNSRMDGQSAADMKRSSERIIQQLLEVNVGILCTDSQLRFAEFFAHVFNNKKSKDIKVFVMERHFEAQKWIDSLSHFTENNTKSSLSTKTNLWNHINWKQIKIFSLYHPAIRSQKSYGRNMTRKIYENTYKTFLMDFTIKAMEWLFKLCRVTLKNPVQPCDKLRDQGWGSGSDNFEYELRPFLMQIEQVSTKQDFKLVPVCLKYVGKQSECSQIEWFNAKNDDGHTQVPVFITLGVLLLVCILIAAIFFIRKYVQENRISNIYINNYEIKEHLNRDNVRFSKSKMRKTFRGDKSNISNSSVSNDTLKRFEQAVVGNLAGKDIYCKPFKQRLVYQTVRDNLQGLVRLKHADNSHIVKFFGITDHGNSKSWVVEYCQNGSLIEVLKELPLAPELKYSLASDLIFGIGYLHRYLQQAHGNLSSYACLIDSRFTLKLQLPVVEEVFGRYSRFAEEGSVTFTCDDLWRAPELLRALSMKRIPTLDYSMDVYSFGIILNEIFYQNGPFPVARSIDWQGITQYKNEDNPRKIFNYLDMKAKTLIPLIMKVSQTPLRPFCEEQDDEDTDMQQLMTLCWKENHTMRPRVKQLEEEILKGISRNEMLKTVKDSNRRMGLHAADLDRQAEMKAVELEEAKNKMEQLCYRLFPHTVATRLLENEPNPTQSHQTVTCYTNDIVGFTVMCSQLKPVEIVLTLNKLFMGYEKIADLYDVYPLCRQGDSFTLVSGAPERNPDHASEIAQAAIQINEFVSQFDLNLPFMQGLKKLRIRSGISSGPCVSGVIRAKAMPQFVVIGRMMQDATLMESSGKEMKIQLSKETKTLLEISKMKFKISERSGENENLAKKTTYWLNGIVEKIEIPTDKRIDYFVHGKTERQTAKTEKQSRTKVEMKNK